MKTTKMRGGFGMMAGMIMAVLAMASGVAQAQGSAAWKQSVTNGNWSLGSNWEGGSAATGTTGIATFTNAPGVNHAVTNDSSPWTINGMVFSNSGAFGWTITSGTLSLAGATPTITVNNTGTGQAILSSALSGTAGLIKDGAGWVNLGTSFGGNLTSGGTSNLVGGVIIKAGTLGLVGQIGSGNITIGDTAGGSTAAATLNMVGLGTSAVLPAYPNAIVLGATSGLLTINATTSGGLTLSGGVTGANNLRIEENNTGSGSITFSTASLNNTGAITNAGTGAAGTTVTISSVIGGNVTGLTQSGINKLALSGASPAFIGDTTLTTGTLNLQNINSLQSSVLNMNGGSVTFGTSATVGLTSVALGGLSGSVNINLNNFLTVPTAVNLTLGNSNASYAGNTLNPTYSGILSSANGAASLTKVGSNTQTLTGASTYMGPTAVNGGMLDLGGSTANGSLASTNLNLGGGTLSYTRTGGTTQAFSNTTATVSFSSIRAADGATLKLGTLASSGGTVDIGTNGTITTSTGNNPNGFIGSWATFNNGATWAVANGVDNAITGLSDATYTNTSSAGTTAGNYLNANIDVNSSPVLDGVITPYGLRFNTAGAYTVTLATGTNTLTWGGILVTPTVGANLSTITGGTLNGAASAFLNVVQNNTVGGLTIGSIIADNTTATGLAKTGAGLLTLTGTNVYTGATMIEGTLTIGGAGRLGTNGTYAASITNNGALVYSSSAAQSLSGIISGTGSVTKDTSSSSTLTLSGANTFTGGLFVKAGTVVLGTSATSGGAGSITIGAVGSADATLSVGGNLTLANAIILGDSSGIMLITQGSANSSVITGGFTGTGNLSFNKSNNGGVFTFQTGILNNTGTITITFDRTSRVDITSEIGSTVKGLTLNSPTGTTGSLTLSAASPAFIGDTTVTAGILNPKSTSALQNSVLNMNGGSLTIGAGGASTITALSLGGLNGSVGINLNNNATTPAAVALTVGNSNASYGGNTLNPTYSGVLSNATAGASFTKVGSNIQTLSGANTYSGGTTVSNGTLFVNNTSGSGTGSGAVGVASSATLGGVGTITGTVTVAMGGILAPGTNSVGTLTIRDLVMVTNSVLKTDCLNGLTDLVEVTGQLTAQSNVTVNVNLVGALPSRVTLFHAPNGIITPENLATWSKINAQNYSRIIWDDSAKTVVMVTQSGTILSAY